jgi:hypothetical protein
MKFSRTHTFSLSVSLSVSHTDPVGLPCEGRDKHFRGGKDAQEVDEVWDVLVAVLTRTRLG